jgi:hypothetical protein
LALEAFLKAEEEGPLAEALMAELEANEEVPLAEALTIRLEHLKEAQEAVTWAWEAVLAAQRAGPS